MQDIRFLGKPDFKIENPGFVCVMRDEDFTFEYKKGKKKHSLIYVENGNLEYFFKKDKKTIQISKGTLLFVPKKIPYKAKYLTNDTLIKIFIFDIDAPSSKFKEPFIAKLQPIKKIFDQCSGENTRNTFFLFSKIYELLYILQSSNISTSKINKKILPAILEIHENFSQNKKISYYADLCLMSESNFRKLFKEQTGKTPIEYRNLLRLEEVKKMIDSGEYNVSEAAYANGFNNMSFFYQLLKETKKDT